MDSNSPDQLDAWFTLSAKHRRHFLLWPPTVATGIDSNLDSNWQPALKMPVTSLGNDWRYVESNEPNTHERAYNRSL